MYHLLGNYVKNRVRPFMMYILFIFVFLSVFYIYQLPIVIVLYASLIWLVLVGFLIGFDFYNYYKKHLQLMDVKKNIAMTLEQLPEPRSLEEEDYQELIHILSRDKVDLISKADQRYTDLLMYYTLWTHQIKTPLSVIDFLIQSGEEGIHDDVELQILEVEKYVDMALQYLRIDSMSSDLKLESYEIQKIINRAVTSYSKFFIYQGIGLELRESNLKVVTDEKWLLFVIKQLLSNAIKYTEQGTITIYSTGPILTIQDTGMGIYQEDIPRLFERGFTGYSGRFQEKSTGLGLYLCKKILNNLGHTITISSTVAVGTKVQIDLSNTILEIE